MNILEDGINENQFVECLQRNVPFYLSHLIDHYNKHTPNEDLSITLLMDLCKLCHLPDLMNDKTQTLEQKYLSLSLAIAANKDRIQELYEVVECQ